VTVVSLELLDLPFQVRLISFEFIFYFKSGFKKTVAKPVAWGGGHCESCSGHQACKLDAALHEISHCTGLPCWLYCTRPLFPFPQTNTSIQFTNLLVLTKFINRVAQIFNPPTTRRMRLPQMVLYSTISYADRSTVIGSTNNGKLA
jgi:hypothetical protein